MESSHHSLLKTIGPLKDEKKKNGLIVNVLTNIVKLVSCLNTKNRKDTHTYKILKILIHIED